MLTDPLNAVYSLLFDYSLIATFGGCIAISVGAWLALSHRSGQAVTLASQALTSPFPTITFDGQKVNYASDRAQSHFNMSVGDTIRTAVDQLNLIEPGPFGAALDQLVKTGVPFTIQSSTKDARELRLDGALSAMRAVLTIQDVTERDAHFKAMELRALQDQKRHRALTEAVEAMPVLTWRADRSGEPIWTNTSGKLTSLATIASLKSALTEKQYTPGDPPTRITLQQNETSEPKWHEVIAYPDRGDGALYIARAMNDVMRAEQALSRFLETLTETFAHLPIGLAIFDADRTLGLFNPALSDHLGLEPAWLAGRPTLRAFLDRLRESRVIPEQADFKGWREQFTSMERAAEEEQYCEIWHLPTGHALRVTGRPHPQGAIAFLFEEITTAIALEQKYSVALALREATIERVPAQIAVFDASGMVVLNTFEASPAPTVQEVKACAGTWAARFGAPDAWDRMVAFATDGRSDRTARHDDIVTRSGAIARLDLAPLPGGGTMVCLSERNASPLTLKKSPHQLTKAAPVLTHIANDALALAKGADVNLIVKDLPELAQGYDQPARLRAIAANLTLCALGRAASGTSLTLEINASETALALSYIGSIASDQDNPSLSDAILRRFIDAAEGAVETLPAQPGTYGRIRVILPIKSGADAAHTELLSNRA